MCFILSMLQDVNFLQTQGITLNRVNVLTSQLTRNMCVSSLLWSLIMTTNEKRTVLRSAFLHNPRTTITSCNAPALKVWGQKQQ